MLWKCAIIKSYIFPCSIAGGCDFEQSKCTFQNLYDDDIDWVRIQGSSPSGFTGPENDHTLGTAEGK